MENEEVDLIRRVQEGQTAAFDLIMRRYGERVMSCAYQFTKNTCDAEDLYQETFLKVYRNIHTFRFESEFFTWVYRILSNHAFNFYRRRKRMSVVDPGEDDYLWETIPADEDTLADAELYNPSLRDRVDRALVELSSQQRVVFILKHYEGKKIKEIAALLDCTEGTVKRYLFRATRKLQYMMGENN